MEAVSEKTGSGGIDDDVIGREAARLDSPDQRPGTNAEATPHKAQRAVTPWSPRVTAPWALEPRHGNPIPQASGLGCRVWPRRGSRGAQVLRVSSSSPYNT